MAAYPMSYGAHVRATLVLGLPLVGSSLAQMALHVVNTVMVGWYGVVPLAGLVLGAVLFFLLFVVGGGFAKAVMPIAAEADARADDAALRRVGRMGLWLSTIFGVLVYPLFWFSAPLFLALQQQPEVAAEAQGYLRVAGIGLVAALAVSTLQGWLAALGRTQVVLWVTVAALFLMIPINWLLIFGHAGAPEMGVVGAGIASTIVQVLSFAALALYASFLPALRRLGLFRRFWRMDRAMIRRVFRLGWPIGMAGLAESGFFQASAIMMGWIGVAELAAHGIALEAVTLAFMVHIGFASAATIRVAGFQGRGDIRSLREAALVAAGLSMVVALAVIVIFLGLPETIVGLFLDPARPDSAFIISLGVTMLGIAAISQLADAMQGMAQGLLRGLQDTRVPMALAAVSYWGIGMPAAYMLAFSLGYGPAGIWIGLVVGLTAAAVGLVLRFWQLVTRLGAAAGEIAHGALPRGRE